MDEKLREDLEHLEQDLRHHAELFPEGQVFGQTVSGKDIFWEDEYFEHPMTSGFALYLADMIRNHITASTPETITAQPASPR